MVAFWHRHPRQRKLPKWIRFCSWVFLVIGTVNFVGLPIEVLTNDTLDFQINGARYRGPVRAPASLMIYAVTIFFGWVAFSLLWGRKNGRTWGLIAGYLGLALSPVVLIRNPDSFITIIIIVPALQIPFLLAMRDLKGTWNAEAPHSDAQASDSLTA